MIKDEFFTPPMAPREVSKRDASLRMLDDKLRPFTGTQPDQRTPTRPALAATAEESLVVDDRSALTPAQAVENKLMSLLQETSMPISHLQMRGLLRNRCDA